MKLSGRVPGEIRRVLTQCGARIARGDPQSVDLWAVHPGGRTILDAVEQGLGLSAEALMHSRGILARFGNMSSASIMFVLEQIMRQARAGQQGCAMSFGPGVTAETMHFHAA
jgi:predicted naringenin-chalcone synthase